MTLNGKPIADDERHERGERVPEAGKPIDLRQLRAPKRSDNEQASTPEPELVSLGSLFGPALDRAERRRSGEEQPVPTPFPSISDALGGGLHPGLHTLVSATGVGKSAFSIQIAINAAVAGVPTIYVGLELEPMQIAIRVAAESSGQRWSSLYLGRCNEDAVDRARAAAAKIAHVPFYCEFSSARGWNASRMHALCKVARRANPTGPLLIVVDYLQLVGDDALPGERRPDTRERISDASMKFRDVARAYDAAVLVISSVARQYYALLHSDAREAGLISRRVEGKFAPVRAIANPHVLVGLGKESGETEFSSDSVSVLIRWPAPLPSGETPVIFAAAKLRAGEPRWCPLAFNGGRFRELPDVYCVEDLPEVAKRGGKGKPVNADDLVSRVVETVRRAPGTYRSKTAIANSTVGTKRDLLSAVEQALDSGELIIADGLFAVRGSEESNR